MPEHYSKETLGRTKDLYATISTWAKARGDVSVIGGWAVYEHVEPGKAMQSRDVDIVMHSEAALQDLWARTSDWNLVWRTKGRSTFPDAHFKDEEPLIFRLDVFTTQTNPTWDNGFRRHGAGNVKQCPAGYLPPIEWLITDKLRTVHVRTGPDAADKCAKDLIDIHNLVFHNKAGMTPGSLARRVATDLRRNALPRVDESVHTHPRYRDELRLLTDWLAS